MENKQINDPPAWKRKAMAFAIRAHRHLWGKNNEDPLIFLYRQGLSHDYAKQLYLGWNKFGQDRPFEGWGMNRPGKFHLPPGIVFPHIVDKDLKGVFIISMADPSDVFTVPGSAGPPLILGDPDKAPETLASTLIEGLIRFQDENGTVRIERV